MAEPSNPASTAPGTRLAGRVALITGGASGIGKATAQRFVAEGARVCVADRDRAGAQAAAAELARQSGREDAALALTVDVRDPASVAAMVADTAAGLGGLDILVASAGIGRITPLLDVDLDTWNEVLAVNLTGTMLCTQAAAREMVRRGTGGRIVHLASAWGVRGVSFRAAYGASKAGVIHLTQTAALELAKHRITVNALLPSPIETPMVAANHSPHVREVSKRQSALGRYGQPEDVAAAALFLASEESGFITGHSLAVDGGYLGAGLIFEA